MRLSPGYRNGWTSPANYNFTSNQYWPHFLEKAKEVKVDLPRKIKIASEICFALCIDTVYKFFPFIEKVKPIQEIKEDLWLIDEDLALFEEDI